MPKQKQAQGRSTSDGHSFAMEVARDLVTLPQAERGKAIKMLTALHETITRESAPSPVVQ